MAFRSRRSGRRGSPCSWILLIPIGIICGIIGVVMLISNIALVANGVKTTGTVVDVETRVETEEAYTDEDGRMHPATTSTLYAPVIEFKTEDGSTVRYTERLFTDSKPSVGSTRAIIYDKGNPQNAKNDSPTSLWLVPLGLILFGLVALAAGIIGFILLKRAAKALLGAVQSAPQGSGASGILSNLAAGMMGASPPQTGAPIVPPTAPQAPINPQLADYVKQSRAAGMDDAAIRTALAGQGWSAPDIDASLR